MEILLVERGGVSVRIGSVTNAYGPGIYLTGQLSRTCSITLHPKTKLHFYKLAPWVNRGIAGRPLDSLNDQIVPLADLHPSLARDIAAHRFTEIMEVIDQAMKNREDAQFMRKACQRLSVPGRNFGEVKTELLREFGLSAKTMENRFKRNLGLTPKQFCLKRNLRQAVEAMLYQSPATTLTEIALDSGFYDQSHFIRSFRELFRSAPSRVNLGHYFVPNSVEAFRYYTI
ncbi:MAG: helix-turn-helix domain-containing protein [Bacteroidota bacterium]